MDTLHFSADWNPERPPEIPLKLSERVGVGGDRECWRHPINPSLCIKVAKPNPDRFQNAIEFHYAQYLERRNVSGRHMTRVHGWVQTNRGHGLIVDMVQQPDGQPCMTLPDALRSGTITQAEAAGLVGEAFDWLVAHKVVLADCGGGNLLVRWSQQGSYLVFVDGLGARHFGFKYWSRRTFGFLARRKAVEFRAKLLRMIDDKSSKLWIGEEAEHLA
jgi:hypothetical protein